MKTIGKTTIVPSMEDTNPDDWEVRTPQAEFWYVSGDEPCEKLPGYPEGIVIAMYDGDTSINIVVTEEEIASMLSEFFAGRKRHEEWVNAAIQLKLDTISSNE